MLQLAQLSVHNAVNMCDCGACGNGPVCGVQGYFCQEEEVCSCDGQTCEQASRIGDGTCDDELQDTGHLLNCEQNQFDGGDCAYLYDRDCETAYDCDVSNFEHCSCDKKCAPDVWVGDNICDDAEKRRGHNFDCAEYADDFGKGDGGDCQVDRACGPAVHHLWGTQNCHDDEVCSCNQDCVQAGWVGNNECDATETNGHHLNCERFEYDGGDCRGVRVPCRDTQEADIGAPQAGGSRGFLAPLEHLLTSFHIIIIDYKSAIWRPPTVFTIVLTPLTP